MIVAAILIALGAAVAWFCYSFPALSWAFVATAIVIYFVGKMIEKAR